MKKSSARIQYLNEEQAAVTGISLRSGSAGCVYAGNDGGFATDLRIELSANATHALIGHGVVDALNELPLEGRLGNGLEVLIPPAQLDAARQLFYRADEKTYGRSYEFVVDPAVDSNDNNLRATSQNVDANANANVEYRIRIDNREYQNALSGLQYLLRTASHEGMAVWLII